MADAPPFVALETEKDVLGCCLEFDGLAETFVAEGLRESHFWRREHQAVWRRLVEALTDDVGSSFLTVRTLLDKHGELEAVGPAYLSNLLERAVRPSPQAIHAITKRLVECAVGRRVTDTLRKAAAALEDDPEKLTEGFFSRVEASLQEVKGQLAGRRIPDHVEHIGDIMQNVLVALRSGPPEFIDTPYPSLNTMLGGGFAPGELVFLGARPGLGKTAMAIEIARRAAKKGAPVFVVSREMLTSQIGLRALSQEGPVNAMFLRKRDLDTPHWRTIEEAIESLEQLPIFMTHAEIDIDEIRRIVGMLCDEGSLGLVIVDYLQLIDAPAGVKERRLQVEAVSKGLKALTLRHKVPVLCLSSLSRPPDGRKPTLASLRESGNLEHDADTVILLHRENELEPWTECIVPKSRNGRTGAIDLYFRGEFLRFEEHVA